METPRGMVVRRVDTVVHRVSVDLNPAMVVHRDRATREAGALRVDTADPRDLAVARVTRVIIRRTEDT